MDVHLETLAQDLVKAFDGEGAPGDVTRALHDLMRGGGRSDSAGGASADGLAKLVAAMRLLDDSLSLRAILDALARGAGAEAACVAVLLLDGDTLRSFSQFGFTAGRGPADLPADSFSVLARVAGDRQRIVVGGGDASQPLDLPGFMKPPAGRTAVLLPLLVAGKVVAVVFAEGVDRQTPDGAGSVWTEHVEVLVRHAASRLENITSRRTVEVLTATG